MSSTNKILLGLVSLLVVFTIGAVIFITNQQTVIAKVGDETITKDELTEYLMDSYGTQGAETLALSRVIEMEADLNDVIVTDEEVEKELTEYIDLYGGEEAFLVAIENNGLTKKTFEEEIKQYLKSEKLIADWLDLSDEDLENYFEENRTMFDVEEQIEASHILIEDLEIAEEVVGKLDEGEDFSELALEYSTDTTNAETGGELGFFARNEMVSEFDDAAFEMEVGDVSEPVETEFGYHIIKVTDQVEEETAEYSDVKEEVYDALLDEQFKAQYNTWIMELMAKYEIEYTL